mmetsp:Transcript_112632/g.359791  ORF Transcript_112632/g.359791 Transcript_112632/m.359791 type:complete len:188 (-) Transcript_112632:484-1047(-)
MAQAAAAAGACAAAMLAAQAAGANIPALGMNGTEATPVAPPLPAPPAPPAPPPAAPGIVAPCSRLAAEEYPAYWDPACAFGGGAPCGAAWNCGAGCDPALPHDTARGIGSPGIRDAAVACWGIGRPAGLGRAGAGVEGGGGPTAAQPPDFDIAAFALAAGIGRDPNPTGWGSAPAVPAGAFRASGAA